MQIAYISLCLVFSSAEGTCVQKSRALAAAAARATTRSTINPLYRAAFVIPTIHVNH